MKIVSIIVALLSLPLCFWNGYQIKYKKRVELIPEYDPKLVKDPSGMADFVGSNLLYQGMLFLFCAVCGFLYSEKLLGAIVVLIVALFGIFGMHFRMVMGVKRYVSKPEDASLSSNARQGIKSAAAGSASFDRQFDERGFTRLERVIRDESKNRKRRS